MQLYSSKRSKLLHLKVCLCKCLIEGEMEWNSTKQLYQQMLNIFDKLILKTFGCCHVQFIMFFICKFKLVSQVYFYKSCRDHKGPCNVECT